MKIIFSSLAKVGAYLPAYFPVGGGHKVDDAARRAAGTIAAFIVFIIMPGWLGLIAALPIYYAGTFIPDILLSAEDEKTRKAIDRELPEFAESLAILTGAGLSLSLALPEAAAGVHGLLGALLKKTVKEIHLGMPRGAALIEAAEAAPSRDFRRLAGLIADSERFGTPVAVELTRIAEELRQKQMAEIKEEAQKLPVKMLFPLVFMILPAFILLTAGPMFVAMVK
jgi:tight adherence protein C